MVDPVDEANFRLHCSTALHKQFSPHLLSTTALHQIPSLEMGDALRGRALYESCWPLQQDLRISLQLTNQVADSNLLLILQLMCSL